MHSIAFSRWLQHHHQGLVVLVEQSSSQTTVLTCTAKGTADHRSGAEQPMAPSLLQGLVKGERHVVELPQ